MPAPRPMLGELERAVMECLWALDAAAALSDAHGGVPGFLVRDVRSCLVDRNLAYTTVMTVLDRLARKGVVHRERDGRAWRYVPSASRQEIAARGIRVHLDTLSRPDRRSALVHFVDTASVEELDDLRAALAQVGGESTPG